MEIQQTSREAYYGIQRTLSYRQRVVYQTLLRGPLTNNEVAELLGWRINTVTPRVNELVKLGLVREKEKRPCRLTGFKAIAWEVRYKQESLFETSH